GVRAFAGAKLRSVEVALDLAASGEAAAVVDELGERPHAVHRALEQPGPGGVVDVGDDGDADGVRRDPDLPGCRLLLLWAGARRRGGQRPHEPEPGDEHDPTRSVHGAPLDRPRPVRDFVYKIAGLVTAAVTRWAVGAFLHRSPGIPGGRAVGGGGPERDAARRVRP